MNIEYLIHIDERDRFYATVDCDGKAVYSVHEESISELIEDGFMKNKYDSKGLLEYLTKTGLIN